MLLRGRESCIGNTWANNDMPDELAKLLYPTTRFIFMKHAPFNYSIFRNKKLQNSRIDTLHDGVINVAAKIWNQFYFGSLNNELNLTKS